MDSVTSDRSRVIPEGTLRRLPLYHRFLQELYSAGTPHVSCSVVARALDLDPTQVRKDIGSTGIVGKPKVGYPTLVLIRWIEDFMGWNNAKEAILVGAGGMGSALMGYEKFRKFGLHIVAAFDIDPDKIGQPVHGKVVQHVDALQGIAQSMHIRLGVIATPAAAAQQVADLMAASGIRAIWNFAPIHLRVPDSVILQNEDLYDSLASLSFKLERRLMEERGPKA